MGRIHLQLAPVTRSDCLPGGFNESRPCRWKDCRYHLDAERRWLHQAPDMTESCTLDVADRGGATLEEIGDMLGLTRERVRQVEEEAMERFTKSFLDAVR